MYDLKAFQAASKKVTEKRSENSVEAYDSALKIMTSYQEKPSITRLEQAGKKFIEALEFNNKHLPSLIYLSYIFYALGNEEMCLKYIRMAEEIQPQLPAELIKYKNAVIKRLSEKSKV